VQEISATQPAANSLTIVYTRQTLKKIRSFRVRISSFEFKTLHVHLARADSHIWKAHPRSAASCSGASAASRCCWNLWCAQVIDTRLSFWRTTWVVAPHIKHAALCWFARPTVTATLWTVI